MIGSNSTREATKEDDNLDMTRNEPRPKDRRRTANWLGKLRGGRPLTSRQVRSGNCALKLILMLDLVHNLNGTTLIATDLLPDRSLDLFRNKIPIAAERYRVYEVTCLRNQGRIGIRKIFQVIHTMPAIQKITKKRPAPSQDGQKGKKARISTHAASKHGDESVKKRRQPVTLPIKEINEHDSDDEFGDEESGEENGEESPAGDEMDIDNGPSKDPNGLPLRALALVILISIIIRP